MFFHECQLFIWTLFYKRIHIKKTHTQITLKRLKKLNVAQISIIKNYPLGKNWLHSVYELGVIFYNKFPTKPKST